MSLSIHDPSTSLIDPGADWCGIEDAIELRMHVEHVDTRPAGAGISVDIGLLLLENYGDPSPRFTLRQVRRLRDLLTDLIEVTEVDVLDQPGSGTL